MNKIQASSTALERVMRMRWNRGARGKKDFSRWTGVFEKENQQSFHCVWSWDNTLLSCPSTHTHTPPYSPTFSHKSFDKWLAHRCCWSTPLHSCPCPSQHGNGGPRSYSTQQLPPPSWQPRRTQCPPDDWKSSHNHNRGSRSWHAVAQRVKQVADIVCWALRTGVSQSRDQDKEGVELLSYQGMWLIMSRRIQICHCVWLCVWPAAGMWLPSGWKEKVFIASRGGRALCFDVELQGKFVVKIHVF